MEEKQSLDYRILHVILHGLPAVGKTCVKQRLTSQGLATDRKAAFLDVNGKLRYRDDDGSCSTLVAEGIVRARVTESSIALTKDGEDQPWNLLNIHEEITALVKKISHKSIDTPSSEEIPSGVQQPTSATSPVAPVGMEFERIVVKAFKEASIQELQDILKGTLVYLIDSGGQPQFQELLPTLVSGPSLFLLTFSLAVGLYDEYEVTFTPSDGKRVVYPTNSR